MDASLETKTYSKLHASEIYDNETLEVAGTKGSATYIARSMEPTTNFWIDVDQTESGKGMRSECCVVSNFKTE